MTHPLEAYIGKTVQLEVDLYSVDKKLDGTTTSVTVGREGYEFVVHPDYVKPILDPETITDLLWSDIGTIEGLDKHDLSRAIHELLETLGSNHVEETDVPD